MASTGGSGTRNSQLTRFMTGGGSKAVNWRFLLLTCLLSLATVTGILFFNPGGIVPRGLLLPAPPKKKEKGGKGKEEEGGEEGSAVQQGEVPVEKGEDEVEYETLGAKAVEAFKQGDYARALQGFTAALKLGKSMRNVAAQQRTLLSNRAAAHEKLGRLDLALDDCAQILRTEPTNVKAQKRRERIRDMLLARGEYQAALTELMVTFLLDMEAYKRTLLLNPSAAAEQQLLPPSNLDEVAKSAARMMVEELEAAGERTVAKVLPSTYTIKQVLQILPSYEALRARASSLRPIEEISNELEGTASDDAPRRLKLLFERALTHVAESRFQRADQDLQAALGIALDTEGSSLEGEEQAALFSWGGTFLHLKHELDKAKEVLERACDLSPTDPEMWVKRACLHLDRNETDQAKTHFDHATSLAPDAAFVYLWRCQLWMCGKVNEESLQKAEAELNKCLELDEGNAVALCRLMQCKMQGNDAEAAETAIERAKRAAPRNADVVGAHAEFLLTQGKVDEAGRELEKAIRLDPSNPLPFINKALIAWQAQDSSTARETLRHVIEMDPQYQPAYHFLANLEFKGANSYEESEPAFATIDKGISICRSKDDLEEMCQIKALAIAKLDAAARLGLRAGDLMG